MRIRGVEYVLTLADVNSFTIQTSYLSTHILGKHKNGFFLSESYNIYGKIGKLLRNMTLSYYSNYLAKKFDFKKIQVKKLRFH